MKNLSIIKTNIKGAYSELTTTVRIPFKKLEVEVAHITLEVVIDAFRPVIIKSLEDRMEACTAMLSKNLFGIIHSDEHSISYKKENGQVHTFHHGSYRAMQEAITIVDNSRPDLLELIHYDQILKSLFWCTKREDCNNISFGNLISAILEMHMYKQREV